MCNTAEALFRRNILYERPRQAHSRIQAVCGVVDSRHDGVYCARLLSRPTQPLAGPVGAAPEPVDTFGIVALTRRPITCPGSRRPLVAELVPGGIPGRSWGFTIIEMMVVILLVAISMALALPSFDSAIKRYRVSAAAGEITNLLQFARMEAIRTRSQTWVLPLTTPGCATTSTTNWHCGILVFDDTNGNNTQDTDEPTAKIIPATDFKGVNVQLSSPGSSKSNNSLTYSPLGFSILSDNNQITDAHAIYVWPTSDGADPSAAPPADVTTICLGVGPISLVPGQYDTNCGTKQY